MHTRKGTRKTEAEYFADRFSRGDQSEHHGIPYGGKEVCRDCELAQGEDCVTLCPLHAAAEDLLAACKDALFVLENITSLDFSLGGDAKVRVLLGAAIAKAGKE